jgi:hypothetical protein
MNKGSPSDAKSFCGVDHSYVKAPLKNWRGIKDGNIRIGTETVAFKDWLNGLKNERWPQAWKQFWKNERSLPLFGAVDL